MRARLFLVFFFPLLLVFASQQSYARNYLALPRGYAFYSDVIPAGYRLGKIPSVGVCASNAPANMPGYYCAALGSPRKTAQARTTPLHTSSGETAKQPVNLMFLLQLELTMLGCDPGPVDGKWGPRTHAALKRFEQRTGKNINISGPQQNTVAIISSYDNKVCQSTTVHKAEPRNNEVYARVARKNGVLKSDVIWTIQNNLNFLGYDAGKADGIVGSKTRSAIREFQAYHRFPQTGTFTESELNFLMSMQE